MTSLETEMMPLLRGKGRYRLKQNPGIVATPIDVGERVEIIRVATGAHARSRQKSFLTDTEKKHIFAARHRQSFGFLEVFVVPPINDRIDVAVAGVHVRRLSRHIFGKLRDGQMELPIKLEGYDRPRSRSRQLLVRREDACAARRSIHIHFRLLS